LSNGGDANETEAVYPTWPTKTLLAFLLDRLPRYVALVEVPAPAAILERDRTMLRDAFEALMQRGPGRSRARDE
jgi:hypothetical protein